MYKKEAREYIEETAMALAKIDVQLIKIKVAVHNLEKLGYNMDSMYNQITNVEIEIKKSKDKIENMKEEI